MKTYTYLSLIPEALILSHLPPEEFGNYLAVGTKNRARGQAVFFEIDPEFRNDAFRIDEARARCVPYSNGTPKRSVYIAIYKVLESLPLKAIGAMYLSTADGRVLRIEAGTYEAQNLPLRLYQEICPVHSMVASQLGPQEFGNVLTRPEHLIQVPRVAFCELNLGELAEDPINGDANNLPYPQIEHLRDCLSGLQSMPDKLTKTVFRDQPHGILYRTVSSGFFVVDATGMLFYPMPSRAKLDTDHYYWWQSARMAFTS